MTPTWTSPPSMKSEREVLDLQTELEVSWLKVHTALDSEPCAFPLYSILDVHQQDPATP